MDHPFLMFLDHTQRRTTVGRTPLDEWSARRRDLYLTTHDTRPEESYRLWCVVVCDLETSRIGAPYIYGISHLRVKIGIIISKVYTKICWFLSGVGVSECICIFMSEVIGHRFLKERNRCSDALPGLSWYNIFPEASTALRCFFAVVYEYMESIQTALTHSQLIIFWILSLLSSVVNLAARIRHVYQHIHVS